MTKKSFDRVKKTVSILLAFFFLISVTAATVCGEEATVTSTDTNSHDAGTASVDTGTASADEGTASSAAIPIDSSNN